MELKYKNWKDININTFQRLQEVLTEPKTGDEIVDNLQQNISILSILCDVDEDDISNLRGSEYKELLKSINFLNEIPKVEIKDSYVINGKKYNVALNASKITMAQYLDFQTFVKDKDKYIREILTCFLIPNGKTYGNGYELDEVKNEIGEHLSIVDAHSIMFFFTLSFRTLTKTTLRYLMKKMNKQKKNHPEQLEKIEEAVKMLKEITDSIG